MPVMATIVRLPYTLALVPDSRGGLLYGLRHYCQTSVCPCVFQCTESAPYPPISCPPRCPSVYRPDAQRRREGASRVPPPAAEEAPCRPHRGPHSDDCPGHLCVHYRRASVGPCPVDD